MSILDNFPHTADAYKRKRIKDNLGGSIEDFSTVVFNERACWRQPASEKEIEEFNKRGMKITHKIYFLTDPGLDDRHLVVVDGEPMLVRSSNPDATAGLGVVFKVMADVTTTGSTPSI